jgi:hypothetical protein
MVLQVQPPTKSEKCEMIRGVVRGKTIELDAETGLPEGQRGTVTVQPLDVLPNKTVAGEGLKRSFGGWNDDDAGLDDFLQWNRRRRKVSRSEPEA